MSRRVVDIIALVVAIVASQLAGAIGSMATAPAVREWYPTLTKPSFNPPSWVFGPVWITLYTLMGIAAWLVWRAGWGRPIVRAALIAFIVQLALNALWSWVFFGFHELFWAFVEIIALWIAIVVTTALFFRVSTWAGVLMIPYILWVSFAAVLNYSIWRLNS